MSEAMAEVNQVGWMNVLIKNFIEIERASNIFCLLCRRKNRELSSGRSPKTFVLQKPLWSFSELNLTVECPESEKIVSVNGNQTFVKKDEKQNVLSTETMEKLSRLALIDLTYSQIDPENLRKDINVILRCAHTLQDYMVKSCGKEKNASKKNERVDILRINSLRSDINSSKDLSKALLSAASRTDDGFFVSPK
jgi:Asp-tRNA(Asn)/Glu-tRNA(Gln) amidotransferase C subunit